MTKTAVKPFCPGYSRLEDICDWAASDRLPQPIVTVQLRSHSQGEEQPLATSCHRASAASSLAPPGRSNLDTRHPLSVSGRLLLAAGERAVRGRGLAEPPKAPVGGPLGARASGGGPELPMSGLKQGAGCGMGEGVAGAETAYG